MLAAVMWVAVDDVLLYHAKIEEPTSIPPYTIFHHEASRSSEFDCGHLWALGCAEGTTTVILISTGKSTQSLWCVGSRARAVARFRRIHLHVFRSQIHWNNEWQAPQKHNLRVRNLNSRPITVGTARSVWVEG